MGIVTHAQFSRIGDFSPTKGFTLNLQNCGPAAREATVTFSGTQDSQNPDLFVLEAARDAANGLTLGVY